MPLLQPPPTPRSRRSPRQTSSLLQWQWRRQILLLALPPLPRLLLLGVQGLPRRLQAAVELQPLGPPHPPRALLLALQAWAQSHISLMQHL